MTPRNFLRYEELGLPMLMLFLDLQSTHAPDRHGSIGGKSGGILNDHLLEEFREVAKEHHERIVFVYIDGVAYADQMVTLGIFGGAERLPAIAFNTKDGRQMPFPERLPINRDTLTQFVADFLSGRMQSAADAEAIAKKALTSQKSLNMKNVAKRKPRKETPEETKGISEQFKEGDGFHVTTVNQSTFSSVVLDESKDVAVMFHSKVFSQFAMALKN